MTLILHLPPDTEARLRDAALAKGLNPAEMAERLLETSLPPRAEKIPTNGSISEERSPEFLATVKRIRGKFAQRQGESSIDILHRERQADKVREERDIRGSRS
jgi:hypothetical protein